MTEQERKHFFPDSLDGYTKTNSKYKTEKLKVYTNAIDSFEVASKNTQTEVGKVKIDGKYLLMEPPFGAFTLGIFFLAIIGGAIYGYIEHDSSIGWGIIWLLIVYIVAFAILWTIDIILEIIYKIINGHYVRREHSIYDTITLFDTDEVWKVKQEYLENYDTDEGRKFLLGKYNPYQLHYLKLLTASQIMDKETSEEKRAREEREEIVKKGEKRMDNLNVDSDELF